jgi:hypothetical protein
MNTCTQQNKEFAIPTPEGDVAGNVIVVYGEVGNKVQIAIQEHILLNSFQRAILYEKEVAYLKKYNAPEMLKLLLPIKSEMGRFYWKEFSYAVEEGVDFFKSILHGASLSVIAMMGSGNYVFNLIGDSRYPYSLSDREFEKYRRAILQGSKSYFPQSFEAANQY